METSPRDGKTPKAVAIAAVNKDLAKQATKPLPPRDRKLPLKLVEFKQPVLVEGAAHAVRKLVAGAPVTREDEFACPKLFVDPELQTIVVEDVHYPMHLVLRFVRAKAA